MCGNRTILPTSCTLPVDGLNVDDNPFAQGGFGDVYNGILNGSTVCVKRLQVATQGRLEAATKVGFLVPSCLCLSSRRLPLDVLPRGRYLEALETPKHTTTPGCHHFSASTYFRLDAWWKSVKLHQREPCRRPSGTCACLFCRCYPTLTPFTSSPTSRRASTTFTHVM